MKTILQTKKSRKMFLLTLSLVFAVTTSVMAQSGNPQHTFSVSASQQVFFLPRKLAVSGFHQYLALCHFPLGLCGRC